MTTSLRMRMRGVVRTKSNRCLGSMLLNEMVVEAVEKVGGMVLVLC
jgi:hypothetical protein